MHEILEHKGTRFLARQGFSDQKTFQEVIVRNVYERKEFKILPGEHWLDLGGNVGAFTIHAISKGAFVDVYEPDPFSCKMIERQLRLNHMEANIHQKAVVAGKQKRMTMYVGNNNQVWRNSLYKNWGNKKFTVDCIHFSKVIKPGFNCKMDIEGAEMDIAEAMQVFPNKLVLEWSLDIDGSLNRYRRAIDRMKLNYDQVKHSKSFYELPDDLVPSYIFPKADMIYCYGTN